LLRVLPPWRRPLMRSSARSGSCTQQYPDSRAATGQALPSFFLALQRGCPGNAEHSFMMHARLTS
jgi:hypothetical protein